MARQNMLAIQLALGIAVPVVCHAQPAEFALRWYPSDGGPKTIEEVLSALGLASEEEENFKVEYLRIAQPVGDVRTIARERVEANGKTESMYKRRGSADQKAAVEQSTCPLIGKKPKGKLEYDVSWRMNAGELQRLQALSWSCTVQAKASKAFPVSWGAKPIGCESSMRRVKSGDFKIEQWTLASGKQVIEVSKEARLDQWQQFQNETVLRLTKLKAQPLEQGMTELASACKS
jgi:hypothetical protein